MNGEKERRACLLGGYLSFESDHLKPHFLFRLRATIALIVRSPLRFSFYKLHENPPTLGHRACSPAPEQLPQPLPRLPQLEQNSRSNQASIENQRCRTILQDTELSYTMYWY